MRQKNVWQHAVGTKIQQIITIKDV